MPPERKWSRTPMMICKATDLGKISHGKQAWAKIINESQMSELLQICKLIRKEKYVSSTGGNIK